MKTTVKLKHDSRKEDGHRIATATRKFLLKKENVKTIVCSQEDKEYLLKIRDDTLKRIRDTRPGFVADFCEDVLCRDDLYFGSMIKVSKEAKEGKLTLLSK